MNVFHNVDTRQTSLAAPGASGTTSQANNSINALETGFIAVYETPAAASPTLPSSPQEGQIVAYWSSTGPTYKIAIYINGSWRYVTVA